MAQKTFDLSIVTPEGSVLEGEATFVAFPSYDGEIGILPNHAPLLCQLGLGVLRATMVGGERHSVFIDGGFAQVTADGNQLMLLTEQARDLGGFTFEEAEELLAEAKQLVGVGDSDVEERDTAFQRARIARRLAQKVQDEL